MSKRKVESVKTVEEGPQTQKRINLNLPKALIDRINEVERLTGEGTTTAVIKSAVRFYASAVKGCIERGETIIVRSKDGHERPIDIEAGIF